MTQQPALYIFFASNGNIRAWTRSRQEADRLQGEIGEPPLALYDHPAFTEAPVATIHVDGSFCHVEWHRPAPNEIHLEVFGRPPR